MNLSGESVRAAVDFFKLTPADILVVHDELDIPFGEVRLKQGGGTAGHNGLKSIQQHLGTNEYARLRLGIDHPGDKNKVSGYVLSDFNKEEAPHVAGLLEQVANRQLPQWLESSNQ